MNPADNPGYVGMCSRCHTPLHWEPHWTNLLLHKRCYEANMAEVLCRQEQEKQRVKTP